MAKAKVKSQEPVKEPTDLLAELSGIETPKQAPEKPGKKVSLPTLTLDSATPEGRRFNRTQAARIVKAAADTEVEAGNESQKNLGHRKFLEIGVLTGAQPTNPQIMTDLASCIHSEQNKWKIDLGDSATVKEALTKIGIPEGIATEVAAGVTVKVETTIKPLQGLRDNPETKALFDKIFGVLMALSPDEKARLIQNDKSFVVDPGFFGRTFAAVAAGKGSTEQKMAIADSIFGVVHPQQSTTSNKFLGSLDEALDLMKGITADQEAAVRTETTTKTVTVKAPSVSA